MSPELVLQHLGLVVSIAKRYCHECHDTDIFEDLVQAGNVGLVEAARRFQPERGCRFSTYATWWIRQAVSQLAHTERYPVRLSASVLDDLHSLHRAAAITDEPSELARLSKLTPSRIDTLRRYEHQFCDISPLDAPECLAIPENHSYEDLIYQRDLHSLLKRLIAEHLSDTEQLILWHRYSENTTLNTLANMLNVSAQRVRQIEQNILGKLRYLVEVKPTQ